jgi:ribonuclease HI
MIELELWTDGSCNNNKKHLSHGVGGWAFIVLDKNGKRIHWDVGYDKESSSSRMEQTAVLEGLKLLKKIYQNDSIKIEIFSDSAYVVNCFRDRWFERWIDDDFLGIKNSDLWIEILNFRGDRKFKMNFNHVKGHSGIEHNETVDYLAGEARKYYLEILQGY